MEQPPWLGRRQVFKDMLKQGDDWALYNQEAWGSQDKHMHTRPCSQAKEYEVRRDIRSSPQIQVLSQNTIAT